MKNNEQQSEQLSCNDDSENSDTSSDCSSEEEIFGGDINNNDKNMGGVSCNLPNDSNEEDTVERKKFDCEVHQHVNIDISTIIRGGNIVPSLVRRNLRARLPKERNICCILKFKGMRAGKGGRFIDYASCSQPSCKCEFKFVGERHRNGNFVKVTIKIPNSNQMEEPTELMAYPLKG